MPSSQKTNFLGLNKWSGTDKPKRSDWNWDNDKTDQGVQQVSSGLSAHILNSGLHITPAEKAKWNEGKSFSVATYVGNKAATRAVALNGRPTFAVVFAVGQPPAANYPFFKVFSGYASSAGCSDGIAITASGLTVYHDTAANPSGYAVALNEQGVTYVCVYW